MTTGLRLNLQPYWFSGFKYHPSYPFGLPAIQPFALQRKGAGHGYSYRPGLFFRCAVLLQELDDFQGIGIGGAQQRCPAIYGFFIHVGAIFN